MRSIFRSMARSGAMACVPASSRLDSQHAPFFHAHFVSDAAAFVFTLQDHIVQKLHRNELLGFLAFQHGDSYLAAPQQLAEYVAGTAS